MPKDTRHLPTPPYPSDIARDPDHLPAIADPIWPFLSGMAFATILALGLALAALTTGCVSIGDCP